jgi:hypothetical protein
VATRGRQEFRVVLEGVRVPKDASAQINKSIQRAVATELAQLDLNKGDLLYRFNPEWLGIWIRPLSRAELDKVGIRQIG